jgi:UDP-glucuronate 4-epimerase
VKALVTGVAGFIGSSLSDELIRMGIEVVGIDCFTDYYPKEIKLRNLREAERSKLFEFKHLNLTTDDVTDSLNGVKWVFHMAGQAGVRNSWGDDFHNYVDWNILATQKLLEAAKKHGDIEAFVAASSSSIYGSVKDSVSEQTLPSPISPYGVSKLAAEHLCTLYGSQFGLPTVSLRYFTAYGPRQRPDMAMYRIVDAALNGSSFSIFGDGNQQRDFTYVGDIVDATIRAAQFVEKLNHVGESFNIAGGTVCSLNDVISMIEGISKRTVNRVFSNKPAGDPHKTFANTGKATQLLGWKPNTPLELGLEKQIKHQFSSHP